MSEVQKGRRIPAATLGIVAVLLSFWTVLAIIVFPVAKRHDFLNLYVGAVLSAEGSYAQMHNPELQLAKEREYVPSLRVLVPFVRPHFYAALLTPLSFIPFDAAFVVWIALHVLLLLAAWYWAWMEFGDDGPALAAMFPATALGIAHGQDVMFMVWIAIFSYILAKRERMFWSGLVLSLALLKFHLILLLPVAILVRREWKMLQGFSLGASVEILVGLALGGIEGSRCYIQDMLLNREGVERLFPSPELMTNIDGLTISLAGGLSWVRLLLVGLVLILYAVAVWRSPFERWFSAAILGSLLIVPHVHGYDLAILLLPLLLGVLRNTSRAVRITSAVLIVPVTGLLPMGGTPWSAAPPAAMIAILAALAIQSFRELRNGTQGLQPGLNAPDAISG